MPIQTNLKIISFVLLGAGGALAITGGILAGVGASADGEKQRLYAAALADRKNNTPIKPEATAEITAQHNTAAALIPTGWVFLSVGLVAAGAGAALFFLTRPRPLTKPKRAQRTPSAPPKTPAYVLGVY